MDDGDGDDGDDEADDLCSLGKLLFSCFTRLDIVFLRMRQSLFCF